MRKLFPNRHWHTWVDTPFKKEAVPIGGWPEWRQIVTCWCGDIKGRYTKVTLDEIIAALNSSH